MGAPLMPDGRAGRRYRGLIKDVDAKIDRLKNLIASAANDQDAWNSTVAAVRRDVEDAEEVLGKFAMEARRCSQPRSRPVCPRSCRRTRGEARRLERASLSLSICMRMRVGVCVCVSARPDGHARTSDRPSHTQMCTCRSRVRLGTASRAT